MEKGKAMVTTVKLEILDEVLNTIITMCRADVDRILGDAGKARREFGFRQGDVVALLETTYEVTVTNEREYRYGFEGQAREVGRRRATDRRVVERRQMCKVRGKWLWQRVE